MSLSPLPNGNNEESDNNKNPFHSFQTNDSNTNSQQEAGKEKFTMGGVKKPKFRPVVNKAVNVHKIGNTQVPIVSTTPVPIVVKQENHDRPNTETPKPKEMPKVKEEKKPKEKPRNRDTDRQPRQPKQNRMQPRFLVSGESKFFATNNSRGGNSNAMDNALLISRQMGGRRGVKKEEEMDIEENDMNDDHELTEENNGPIRFPYRSDVLTPSEHGNMSWDEDDAQVTPLELLRGVNDGELLLFALPSFLPIYAKNREYGINEEAYTHILDTKPHDYVQNELMQIAPGKIGKMRVHESGRITMDINGYIVDMNVSIPLRYQQQVVTIDEKDLNILGNVTHRLVLTPNVQNF